MPWRFEEIIRRMRWPQKIVCGPKKPTIAYAWNSVYLYRCPGRFRPVIPATARMLLGIPGPHEGVKACGRVVRMYEKEDDAYQMAISIMDIDSREYLTLTKYLGAGVIS